ncbi:MULTISPECIES: hypothetical protein [Bradyrhizobium]|uniref:hypothetical protein n=1 Tax=Bradyrhizobium TaxID=374 RepID=UPI0012E343B5|nr:hypothetical protein [Bradyrhizobium retamae]
MAVQESDRSRSRPIWPRAWFLLFAQDLLKIQRGALFSWQAVKVLHSPFDGRQIAGTGNAPSKSHSASPRSMKSGISDACLACCRQSPRQRFAYGQRLISRNGLGGHPTRGLTGNPVVMHLKIGTVVQVTTENPISNALGTE